MRLAFQYPCPGKRLGNSQAEWLGQHPLICFNRRTWAGALIERPLNKSKMQLRSVMEVNSLEAIELPMRHAIGGSIVPQRICAPPYDESIKVVPFADPQTARRLVLVDRRNNPRARLADAPLEDAAAVGHCCDPVGSTRRIAGHSAELAMALAPLETLVMLHFAVVGRLL